MSRIFFIFTLLVLLTASCAKPEPLTPEEEYRRRQERRRREAERIEESTTSLSGLNSFEIDELRRSKSASDLNPSPGSFVYSPRQQKAHNTDKILNELNEEGRKNVREYEKSVKSKKKSGSSWVYGL